MNLTSPKRIQSNLCEVREDLKCEMGFDCLVKKIKPNGGCLYGLYGSTSAATTGDENNLVQVRSALHENMITNWDHAYDKFAHFPFKVCIGSGQHLSNLKNYLLNHLYLTNPTLVKKLMKSQVLLIYL